MPHGHRQQPGRPDSDRAYFEEMTKAVFRSGFSWDVIESKWDGFRKAFAEFDVDVVSDYDSRQLEQLVENPEIVRNGRKIRATIDNARAMQALIGEHGSFHAFLRSLDEQSYKARAKALRNRFAYLGRTGTWTFLWFVGEPVPDWDDR
jgi:3-methyladenine DNA glycosylase Tag